MRRENLENPTEMNVPVNNEKLRKISLLPLLDDEKSLKSLYRKKKSAFEYKNVHQADVLVEEDEGWVVQRQWVRSTRLKRLKNHNKSLEDRVWCLLYSIGYRIMNGENFGIVFQKSNGSNDRKQVDVYAEGYGVVFVVECKSQEERGWRTLQNDIQETVALKSNLRSAIFERFNRHQKPKIIWVYATKNIVWSESDIECAESGKIHILTENELQYFEAFVRHIGPAGRYQILGEFLKGQKIPALADSRLPAIRGKIGGETYYSFVTTPRHLLQIAYINHQALNHPDGQPAYQRMMSSSRIKEIGKFIEKGGFFPTNIVVNFSDAPRFDLISSKENTDQTIKFGWITLPSKFRSAWVIDGQHRLFGFSHLDDKFFDQNLFVLAFEKMHGPKEADLFLTINHKQKSVPRSLLTTLLADIRIGDSDPNTALSALASAVVREMNSDSSNGPFTDRFPKPDIPAEPYQNLTINEVVNGLKRSELLGKRVGKILSNGPLSGETDKDTIKRASTILNSYFEAVRTANLMRWDAGKDAFISVNPGIRAHLLIIGQVVNYLENKKSLDFRLLKTSEFADEINAFCKPILDYIKTANDKEIREKFSRKYGEGGVKEYSYCLSEILIEEYSDFGTEEFQRWINQKKSEEIDDVNQFLMKFSQRLTDFVIDTLKEVHGTHRLESDEQAFWEIGVRSDRIRRNAYEAQQKDKERRKPKEAYLNIVDLAEIVKQQDNWHHFEHIFMNPMPKERSGQKYYLEWINKFNELRNIAAHPNQFKTYSDEDLEFVDWLRTTIYPNLPT